MPQATPILISSPAPAVSIPAPQTRGCRLPWSACATPADLEQEIERISRAGFNLVLFPIFTQGLSLFPSETMRGISLPRIHPQFKKWDPLATATQLTRQANLSLWGLAQVYHLEQEHAPTRRRLLKSQPRWRMSRHPQFLDLSGRPGPEHVKPCPLQRGKLGQLTYRHVVGDMLVEAVSGYPLDGLVLDCTGFGLCGGPLSEYPFCFCDNCKARYYEEFESNLLEDARGPRLDQVRAWQRQEGHSHLSYLRHRLMRTRRTLRLVCMASPDWRRAASYDCAHDGGPLLHWPELLGKGEIEELLVHHDGERATEAFGSRMASDFAYLGDQVLSLPLLSVRHPGELQAPLAVLARYTMPGFIAEFPGPLSEAFMIELGTTLFPEAAPLPEAEPIRAAMFFLERVRLAHENQPKLHDLMSDFLRLLARQLPEPHEFQTILVIEQNIHGLEQFIRRGWLGQERIPDATLRFLGLARRFVRMALMDVRS